MKNEKIFSKKITGGEKMNNWKLAILPLVLLFVVGIAHAAVTATLRAPLTTATVAGTYTLNCTATADDYADGTTLDNATFYYGSTSIGSNSTETNGTTWTYSWDSTAVADHIADFKCTVTDLNATTGSDTEADVIIDNTVPACTWTNPTENDEEIETGETLKVTLTGTGGEDATCTKLTFGVYSYTPTLASGGGSCSWQEDGMPPEGIETLSFTASDGTNSTTCSLSNIIVQEEDYTPAIAKKIYDIQTEEEIELEKKGTANRIKNFGLILGLCLLGWIVFGKKK